MEPHKHCHICGTSIPTEENLCSEKCKDEYDKLLKKRRNRVYLIYALMAVFLALVLFQMYGG